MSEIRSTASFDWLENERTRGNGSVPCCPDYECSTIEGGKAMDILSKMKQLHEERLLHIEKEAGRDSAELKVKALESWVADLEDQNAMLVEVLGKLEQEATERVRLLKEKLQTSTEATSKFMESEQDRDRIIAQLTEENAQFQKTVVEFFNKHQQLQAHIASQYEQNLGKIRTQKLQSTGTDDLDESINTLISSFNEVVQERLELLQEIETLKSELASKTAEIESLNNKVVIMDELESKLMPKEPICCKEVCVGTESVPNVSAESYITPILSVKEIYNYRHMVKPQKEGERKLGDDVKDSKSNRLHTEETEVEFIDLRANFGNSSASEEDTSLAALHNKLTSTQNLVKALKGKAQSYVEDLRMAEQNQADSERRIGELKSILEMSQHQVRTTLQRASQVNTPISYVQEVQKYNEGSQEALKNMRAEIHFLLFNLRSRTEKSSDFEESISSLELSLQQLQESLLDIQNIMNVNAVHAQSAPNQVAFERSDIRPEELQMELNKSVAEVDKLQESFFKMKCEFETTSCSLDAKEQIVRDQEEMISILHDSVNTAQKEQKEVQRKLATLENEKEKALSELEEVEKRAENLQEALMATKKQLEELQGNKFEVSVSSWGWPHSNRNATRHSVHDV